MSTVNNKPDFLEEGYNEVPAFDFGESDPITALSTEEDLDTPAFDFDSVPEEETFGGATTTSRPRLRLQDLGKEEAGSLLEEELAQMAQERGGEPVSGDVSPSQVTIPESDIDPKLRTADAQEAELPYFESWLDAPEIQAQKEKHGAKPEGAAQMGLYLAQEAGKGVAGAVDLATAAVDAAPVLGYVKHEVGKVFGAIPKDQPYTVGFGATTESYKEKLLPQTYEALGYDIDEVKPVNALQRAYGLAAENVVAGAALKPIQMAVSYLGSGQKIGNMLWDSYTKGELLSSSAGAVAGGVGYSMFETEEGKEQAAYLGNFAGALFPSLKYASGAYWLKRTADNYRGNAGAIDDLSDRLINQDIAKLVPVEDIPEIKRRIEVFRELQEVAPDFTPTWSSLIQTPRMKQVQAWTDTQVAEKAEVIYKRNNDIIKDLANRFGLDPKGEHYEAITKAAAMVAAQGDEVSRAYLRQINDLQEEIATLGRTASTTDPLQQGLQYRHQLKILEKKFSKHVDSMYAQVDPNNQIKVPLTRITESFEAAREATKKASATRAINYSSDPLAHRFKDLDAIAERLNPSAYEGARNPQAKFNQLIEQRKELDRIARAAAGVEGGSQVYVLARKMADGLNQVLDETLEELGPDTYGAYVAARNSYKNLYLPVFNNEKNVVTRHLSTTVPRGKEFVVDADKLLKEVWVEGPTPVELSATQINDMLKKASGIVDEKALGPARDVMNLKIQEHALASVNRALREAKDPAAAFKSWRLKNEANLKNFPHVQEKIDDIGREATYKSMGVSELRVKEETLQKEIISKYTKLDVETFLEGIPKMSAAKARSTLQEVFDGAGVKNVDLGIPAATREKLERELVFNKSIPAFMRKLSEIDPASHAKMFELHKSISGEIVAEIIRKGIRNDGNPGLSSNFFNQIMNGNHPGYKIDTLKEVLTPTDYALFENFHKLANATQDTFTPAGKINIQYLQKLEEELGISFSSVSSRIYAQQLGKVGPVYIFTDTGMKLLKAGHGHKLQKQLGDILYDMDALEDAMKLRLKMASGEEKDIIAGQMSKLTAFKKDLRLKAKHFISDKGTFVLEKFVETMADPNLLPDVNRLRAYFTSQKKEEGDKPSNGIHHLYEATTGGGVFMRGGPTDEDWEEFDRKMKNFKLEIEDDEEPTLGPKEPKMEGEETGMRDVVEDLFTNLVKEEGVSGDTTGAAVTGELGVTSGARDAVKGSENMSDQQVAKAYIQKLDSFIPEEVPYEVRYSLIDTAYNAGEGIFQYPKLSKAIEKGDWMGVATNLLDTASIGGESSKGIAGRRARAYNRIAEANGGDLIESVFQAEDGTISYLGEDDEVIFSYRPEGGRHKSSAVGMLRVEPTEMVAGLDTSNGA